MSVRCKVLIITATDMATLQEVISSPNPATVTGKAPLRGSTFYKPEYIETSVLMLIAGAACLAIRLPFSILERDTYNQGSDPELHEGLKTGVLWNQNQITELGVAPLLYGGLLIRTLSIEQVHTLISVCRNNLWRGCPNYRVS